MADKITVGSANYDKAGRLSFSWSRLKNTAYTTYYAEIYGIGFYNSFALNDIDAASSIVPCILKPQRTFSLYVSAGNDLELDPATTSDPVTISGN